MSPGRMTVQGMMPEIFLPGPASPSTAPARMLSRLAHCESERADSSVCGSSSTTRLGRTVRPSGRLNFIPRMRPVRPATLMIAPLAGLPSTVGSTISLAVQPSVLPPGLDQGLVQGQPSRQGLRRNRRRHETRLEEDQGQAHRIVAQVRPGRLGRSRVHQMVRTRRSGAVPL
jgi:hypothetical protein